jgi:hypothetical protein
LINGEPVDGIFLVALVDVELNTIQIVIALILLHEIMKKTDVVGKTMLLVYVIREILPLINELPFLTVANETVMLHIISVAIDLIS